MVNDCLRKEVTTARSITHGMCNTPTHISWRGMKERCINVNHKNYKHYGAKGIKVCTRWLGNDGFIKFLEDMGERPEGTSIDRIKNDIGYHKANCRWATQQQQVSNTSSNITVNYKGLDITASEFARIKGITPNALYSRMKNHNISPEKAAALVLQRDKYKGFTTKQIADLVGCGCRTVYLHVAKEILSPKFGAAIDAVLAEPQST